MRKDILQTNRTGLEEIIKRLRRANKQVERGFVGKALQISLVSTADGRHVILEIKNPTVERAEAKERAEADLGT